MPASGLRRTIDRLRNSLVPSELTDEQLLQRFINERSEPAFAGLVRRHGPMILGVCRRLLGNLHDSEDVFQATFLVLAQKAPTVAKQGAIASWLYKVAYRIALKVRERNSRRHQKEKQVDAMPHPQTTPPVIQDWEVLLDEELNRLPEKYRIPLILCDLEGRSGKEVERQLQVAPGTLSSRLSTARRLLAERLTRRGLTLSAGTLAALMSESKASAVVPATLARTTLEGAQLLAAGQVAAISSSVTLLMQIGAKAMFLAKLKATLVTLVALALVGGGIVYSQGGGQPQPKSELEALRRENELLKVNLRVTLEKIEALEKRVAEFKGEAEKRVYAGEWMKALMGRRFAAETERAIAEERAIAAKQRAIADAEAARDMALKQRDLAEAEALRVEQIWRLKRRDNQDIDAVIQELSKPGGSQKTIDALEKALKKLRAEQKKQ